MEEHIQKTHLKFIIFTWENICNFICTFDGFVSFYYKKSDLM